MQLLQNGKLQFIDQNGAPLANGTVGFYAPGTLNPVATYQDQAGTIQNANPIVLDSRGQAIVWGAGAYRQIVKDASGVTIWDATVSDSVAVKCVDAITSVNATGLPDGIAIIAKGRSVAGDGGGGLFRYSASSSQAVDNGLVFAPATGSGRMFRDGWTALGFNGPLNVMWFGAKFDNATDDTAANQAALNAANTIGGAEVVVPMGISVNSAALNIYKNTTVRGQGRSASKFKFNHTGDGFKSTWPVNSSTAVNIKLQNIGIVNTNASNAGGGFVDVGGTFVDLYSCYISGWKYNVIFDQTEIATIDLCDSEQASFSQAGVWLVNGADHTVGANAGFTNRITITRCQFNAASGAGPNIVDDGGGAHVISSNNFNAGSYALRASGVGSLSFTGNESEGHGSGSIYLATSTSGIGLVSAAYVGPCTAPSINENNITDSLSNQIQIDDCQGGSICRNYFGQATSGNIVFNGGSGSKASAVIIEGNSKLVSGPFRQAAPIANGSSNAFRANIIRQAAVTYAAASQSSGTVTVTPATMEAIRPNTRLWCINADGTNGEQVFVTATTSTTFTAAFASSKAANFLVYGLNPGDQEEGQWTPTLFGSSTAGANTYSTQAGFYSRRGNQVFFTASVVVSAKDAAMAGQLHIGGLPFLPSAIAGSLNAICQAAATGWTKAGYTQLNGELVTNTGDVALLVTGSGSAFNILGASDITGSTFSVYVSGTYLTNSI